MTWGIEDRFRTRPRAQGVAFHDAGGTIVDTRRPHRATGAGKTESLLGQMLAEMVHARSHDRHQGRLSRTREGRFVECSRGALASANGRNRWTSSAPTRRPLVRPLHRRQVPSRRTWRLDYAVSSGKVSYAGVSNNCGWRSAGRWLQKRGRTRTVWPTRCVPLSTEGWNAKSSRRSRTASASSVVAAGGGVSPANTAARPVRLAGGRRSRAVRCRSNQGVTAAGIVEGGGGRHGQRQGSLRRVPPMRVALAWMRGPTRRRRASARLSGPSASSRGGMVKRHARPAGRDRGRRSTTSRLGDRLPELP